MQRLGQEGLTRALSDAVNVASTALCPSRWPRERMPQAHSFSLGRHHPRMPQELIKKRAVDMVVKKLRAEAAASAAAHVKA